MLLDSFSQVDGDGVLELLYKVRKDHVAATQHVRNVQQLTHFSLRLHQCLLSRSEC